MTKPKDVVMNEPDRRRQDHCPYCGVVRNVEIYGQEFVADLATECSDKERCTREILYPYVQGDPTEFFPREQ